MPFAFYTEKGTKNLKAVSWYSGHHCYLTAKMFTGLNLLVDSGLFAWRLHLFPIPVRASLASSHSPEICLLGYLVIANWPHGWM